jgi:hypothetical protein
LNCFVSIGLSTTRAYPDDQQVQGQTDDARRRFNSKRIPMLPMVDPQRGGVWLGRVFPDRTITPSGAA